MSGRRWVDGEGRRLTGATWAKLREFFLTYGWPGDTTIVAIIESVLDCAGAERLAATSSMHDLWVTPRVDGAMGSWTDRIIVRVRVSREVPDGEVRIDHNSPSGLTESVTRPASHAVPLFWRFVTEKWGFEPWRWDQMSDAPRAILLLASEGAGLWETTTRAIPTTRDGVTEELRLDLDEAQSGVTELLRLGIIRIVVEGQAGELPRSDVDGVFRGESLWRDATATPRVSLAFTPEGERWYADRLSASLDQVDGAEEVPAT